MSETSKITPEQHRQQIGAYQARFSRYETYARALKRVLETACRVAIPEASIQSRAKTLSSFAEKCARKFDKYPDAVNQLTDLCGARVVVQTLEQVAAVREFIEKNFEILERDDEALQLSEDKFGYRDLHYIIRLRPDRSKAIGFSEDELEAIGNLRAELQVRTWLQHAWADTFHDRMYKNAFTLSLELRRSGALLAALMEEGDRNFNLMAHELDGMIANYSAIAPLEAVEREIAIERLILDNEPNPDNKPSLALRLARLLDAAGDHGGVVSALDPHLENRDANRVEILLRLGIALCRQNRRDPDSADYTKGRDLLLEALELCSDVNHPFVPNLRKRESLIARTLGHLGWVQEVVAGYEHEARDYKRRAHEHEPENPYYFADMLGYELHFTQGDLPDTMRTLIREAIRTCLAHAQAGIELPCAYFTAGRLSLLLDRSYQALDFYCRGIRHHLVGQHFSPRDVIDEERNWIRHLYFGRPPSSKHQWVESLLAVARRVAGLVSPSDPVPSVLCVAGGAASMDAATLEKTEPLLRVALEGFSGKKVIAGGTVVGIPGCVGAIKSALNAALPEEACLNFELVGYIPKHLPQDARRDDRYDRLIVCGNDHFGPEQILKSWNDLLDARTHPHEVRVLGLGGGSLTALEYRLALALGAKVGIVTGTGGAVAELEGDILWSSDPNLMPLPFDAASVRAYVVPPASGFEKDVLEEMSRAFHENYVAGSSGRLPDNMKPWERLKETFRRANRDQAGCSVGILNAAGFEVRHVDSPVVFADFTDEEVERMAELEHGRWNLDRLSDGWRFGRPRDDARKLHDCLVPWNELPEDIKKYDRIGVRAFPAILAKAGLEVRRREA
jgi:ppGpp synthetase/RelA/SpoT-type nucleotidyltranferase